MNTVVYTLILVNLIFGFGFALPLQRHLSRVVTKPKKSLRYFVILIGIYFVECVAIILGMGIPVFSVFLAFVWGVIFGFWLRERASTRAVIKTSFFLSLYSSLPAASFILIPLVMGIAGHNVLSTEAGTSFGIPDFLHLPWPLNTILGFYAALVIGAVVFKMIITTGEVSLLIHLGHKSSHDSPQRI
ncbi:MAG: hypothetical protein AMJ90_07525 [candidate division Zixibacteria bacterium SM23_73_2]|nr:MAG: hypothetical protein AMJ90_07525 [candidate division Zixibacteria bacterium SM23_73_2]